MRCGTLPGFQKEVGLKIIFFMFVCFFKLAIASATEPAKDCFFTEDPSAHHILLEFTGVFWDRTTPNLSNQLICVPYEEPEALISSNSHLSTWALISILWTSLAHAQEWDAEGLKTYNCKNGDSKLETKLEIHPADRNTALLGNLICRRTNKLNFNVCKYDWKSC
jgi:hypothetical protein